MYLLLADVVHLHMLQSIEAATAQNGIIVFLSFQGEGLQPRRLSSALPNVPGGAYILPAPTIHIRVHVCVYIYTYMPLAIIIDVFFFSLPTESHRLCHEHQQSSQEQVETTPPRYRGRLDHSP
jgi:hypothetical protein